MSDVQPTNRSRSTLSDVAQMAGVSASTVSLVLAGKGGTRRISEDTHTRVHQAARVLGYTPSLLHRSMRRGRTHVLSFYNGFRNRDRSDLYMDRFSAGIEHAGGRHGYDVLVHCNFGRSTQETYEFLNGGLADGLVLFGPPADDPLLPLLRSSGLPTVIVNPREREAELSSVCDDGDQGIELLADALLQRGHRRIVVIVESTAGVVDPHRRAQRLRERMVQQGAEPSDVVTILFEEDARTTLGKVLALPTRPTAIFAWHDRRAYQILEACEEAGLLVPEDVSVVGYDGLVWPSTSHHVVTSIRVPLDDMAERAVALLDRLIEGEPGPLSETLSVQFFTGTTLGPAVSTP